VSRLSIRGQLEIVVPACFKSPGTTYPEGSHESRITEVCEAELPVAVIEIGKAAVTITNKPFWLPEMSLTAKITKALDTLCNKLA